MRAKLYLIVAATIVAAFALGACAAPTPPPAQIVKETVVVEKCRGRKDRRETGREDRGEAG